MAIILRGKNEGVGVNITKICFLAMAVPIMPCMFGIEVPDKYYKQELQFVFSSGMKLIFIV